MALEKDFQSSFSWRMAGSSGSRDFGHWRALGQLVGQRAAIAKGEQQRFLPAVDWENVGLAVKQGCGGCSSVGT